MSAFKLLDQIADRAEAGPQPEPETLLDKIRRLPKKEAQLEEMLAERCWFPYRRLDWIEKTVAFVSAYNHVYFSLKERNARLSVGHREGMNDRGRYLSSKELMAPWADHKAQGSEWGSRKSRRWTSWVKGRRSADIRGMIYEDYISGALLAAIRRGWSHWPLPSHLASDKLLGKVDQFHDATIPGFEAKKYEKQPKLTHDPYFSAAQYQGDPIQDGYYNYLARELHRVYPGIPGLPNQRVERLWRDWQKSGSIPASLSISSVIDNQ